MKERRRGQSTIPQILVYGEDASDQRAIVTLVRALRPDLNVKFEQPKKPLTLMRGLRPETAKTRNSKIVAAVKAANVRAPVLAVLMHEDADAVEPAHVPLSARKEGAIAAAPGKAVAVVPAWEIESWWLLFPEAVASLNKDWKTPTKYVGRDVGLIRNSKEELKRLLRPPGRSHRTPDYSEQDSPKVAAQIVAMAQLASPKGTSASWDLFVQKVKAI